MERTKRSNPAILACDPSFTGWGYAVMRGDAVHESGCIRTIPEAKKRRIREGDDRVRRTSEIIQVLLTLIKSHNIALIVSELPHGSQNAKAAIMMGVVVGIVQTLSDTLKIPVEWYSENDAKKALLGKISAAKQEVINAIDQEYQVDWTNTKYIDEALADSIAIYHVAKKQSPLIKYLNR